MLKDLAVFYRLWHCVMFCINISNKTTYFIFFMVVLKFDDLKIRGALIAIFGPILHLSDTSRGLK